MTGIDTCFLADLDIAESPRHDGAARLFTEWLASKEPLFVYSQVFLEYAHIITDAKRFENPLTMEQALKRVLYWTDQERIKIIHSTDTSLRRAIAWMRLHNLGRKRIADTFMATAYAENGITTLFTANRRDFEIFNVFNLPEY